MKLFPEASKKLIADLFRKFTTTNFSLSVEGEKQGDLPKIVSTVKSR